MFMGSLYLSQEFHLQGHEEVVVSGSVGSPGFYSTTFPGCSRALHMHVVAQSKGTEPPGHGLYAIPSGSAVTNLLSLGGHLRMLLEMILTKDKNLHTYLHIEII